MKIGRASWTDSLLQRVWCFEAYTPLLRSGQRGDSHGHSLDSSEHMRHRQKEEQDLGRIRKASNCAIRRRCRSKFGRTTVLGSTTLYLKQFQPVSSSFLAWLYDHCVFTLARNVWPRAEAFTLRLLETLPSRFDVEPEWH